MSMPAAECISRLFAIVPAAGRSRRMGQPKLLLPLGHGSVISRMLGILVRPAMAATIVVVRKDDEPLQSAATACGATVLQPDEPPPEMRQSVELALRFIAQQFSPRPDDGWFLAPADHPLLDPVVIEKLIAAWREQPARILVPAHRGQRGHPTRFPFALVGEVFTMPPGQGLNRLVAAHVADVREIEVDSAAVIADLDTPEDYERLRAGGM